MSTNLRSLLIITHDRKIIGKRFSVPAEDGDTVSILLQKTQNSIAPLLNDVSRVMLTLYKCIDTTIYFDDKDTDAVHLKIEEAFLHGKCHELQPIQSLGEANIKDETLLVQMPAMNAIMHNLDNVVNKVDIQPIDSGLIHDYGSIFITARNPGVYTEDDLVLNEIVETSSLPQFVADYRTRLGAKRGISCKLHPVAETLLNGVSPGTFDTYCDASSTMPVIDAHELIHLGHVVSINGTGTWGRHGHSHEFTEADADWLLLYHLACRYPSSDNEGKTFVKCGGNSPWPFQLVVQDADNSHRTCYSYQPKSDFAVFQKNLPRLLGEIQSKTPGEPLDDRTCMLLSGASIVRFANKFVESYRQKKNFILLAFYIDKWATAERFILFQRDDQDRAPHKVYFTTRKFLLEATNDRVQFILELYNFFSAVDEGEGEDTHLHIKTMREKIKDYENKFGRMRSVTSVASKKRCFNDNDAGGDEGQNGGTGKAATESFQQLRLHGYVVMPDPFNNSDFKPLFAKPPHYPTVYQARDPKKNLLIAKKVHEYSDELEILEFLRQLQPQSHHVITLFDSIVTGVEKWVLLPKMRTDGGPGRISFAQFGHDLISGLAYLHEHGVAHLDVKPDNLVYTRDLRVQIIDFSSAMQGLSEDDKIEVEGACGTPGWRAPEVEGDGHSALIVFGAIRADRWSCGTVLLDFAKRSRASDCEDMRHFAERLRDKNPRNRPSLLSWSGQNNMVRGDDGDRESIVELVDMNADEDSIKTRQTEVDKDVSTPPLAPVTRRLFTGSPDTKLIPVPTGGPKREREEDEKDEAPAATRARKGKTMTSEKE